VAAAAKSDRDTPAVDNSIKETIESIVVAFILAFVFRAFIVEAFVIPTGSMAPTLLGQHLSFTCPQCGYHFKTDTRDEYGTRDRQVEPYPIQGTANPAQDGPLEPMCPMCEYRFTVPNRRTEPGDRILVLKYVYAFAEPRRWDVLVFRNPTNLGENYIKRLVGLPNEHLQILRGNVLTTARTDGAGEPIGWQVQRKPADVQRAVWQPVYHSRYVPLDDGRIDSPLSDRTEPWSTPWEPAGPGAARWRTLDDGRQFAWPRAAAGSAGSGELRFRFDRRTGRDFYAYNNLGFSEPLTQAEVDEFRIAATFNPESAGLGATLHLGNALVRLRGRIDADGRTTLEARPVDDRVARVGGPADGDGWRTLAECEGDPLPAKRATRCELWYVDHTVQLWRNGERVAMYEIPLIGQTDATEASRSKAPLAFAYAKLRERAEAERRNGGFSRRPSPSASVGVSGSPVTLSDVNLDRDLHYTPTDEPQRALGVAGRRVYIAEDEYFCLGDNSPQSRDSRLWGRAEDWVLYHTPEHRRQSPTGQWLPGVGPGRVPRKLLIGRAFFVYFPAPHQLGPTALPLIPNFGEMRFIH